MNESMENRFLSCVRAGEIPHALLLAGQTGGTQDALAKRAAALYCLEEDAADRLAGCPNYGELDGRKVGVQQVRELMAATAVQSFNGGRRAFVILSAHEMNEQCQNALLKTLEEPPVHTLLILSGSETGLLPTIRSRCAIFRPGAMGEGEIAALLMQEGGATEAARRAARLSGGILQDARELMDPVRLDNRIRGAACFQSALSGGAPFSEAADLILNISGESGERKKKADPILAGALMDLWTGIARDGLVKAVKGPGVLNPDCEKTAVFLAARFTSRQIQGIIETLVSARKSLISLASPQMTIDTVLGALMLMGGQAKEKI